ncbi:TRASH domain-containing protein [Halopelagius longus]|uniref:TRASH domain-containing protein n=1 Tax=Halopelagius longus TaxID=1236180 RepID=A0A1H1GS96_9EURY|nr:TRASH domain-containing protein [Halopelagius longus]SDR16050.1 hypothetical protein SAMN05216278_3819 [Halopelagius longus]
MNEDICTVCGGETHEAEDSSMQHENRRYRFCSDEHKEEFERSPGRFV